MRCTHKVGAGHPVRSRSSTVPVVFPRGALVTLKLVLKLPLKSLFFINFFEFAGVVRAPCMA
jgi:hypothetical protein